MMWIWQQIEKMLAKICKPVLQSMSGYMRLPLQKSVNLKSSTIVGDGLRKEELKKLSKSTIG